MQQQPECHIERTLNVLGKKWTVLILRELLRGRTRFGELGRALNVADKVLTERLRELEEFGVIRRIVYPEVPPRVEYRLTRRGAALGRVIRSMIDWGGKHYVPAGKHREA